MNRSKKSLIFPLIGLLYIATPIHIEPRPAVNKIQFESFKSSYSKIMKSSPIDKNEAKKLIRSLLAETWVIGSEESAQMTKWIEKLGKKANIDIRPLMPEKYEIHDSLYNAAIKTLQDAFVGGLLGSALSLLPMILPMLGGDFTSEMLVTLGQSFFGGATIQGLANLGKFALDQSLKSSDERPPVHMESLTSFLAKKGAAGPQPDVVSLPKIVQAIPVIGKHLAGIAVPGWVAVFAQLGLSVGTGYAIDKAKKSPWIYSQLDKITDKLEKTFLMDKITDFEFTEDDINLGF